MNENYQGSIELISGLKQKNNLDFPLMEASAVAFYDDVLDTDGNPTGEKQEVRLTEKIKQVGISETDKKQLIKDAVEASTASDKFTTLVGRVDKNTASINASTTGLLDRVSVLEEDVKKGDNQELKLQFEKDESILYLYAGDKLIKPGGEAETNVISQAGITGGGAGATLNYAISLTRVEQESTVVFLHKDTPKIKFNAGLVDTSTAEGEEVPKELNFKLTVKLPSGVKNIYTFTGESNTNLEHDLTSALSTTSGLILGNHDITLTASYTQEVGEGEEAKPVTIQATKSWIVKITEMYLTSTFDDKSVKNTDIPLSVTVFGDLNKTIHYNLGNTEDWKTVEAPMSNYEYSITIPKQPHGNYPLEIYLLANVNGKDIKSDSLFYDVMFREDGNNTPIIRAVPESLKGQQYTNLAIGYSVYTPQSLISEVELAVDGQVVSTLDNVDRSEQTWNYKPMTEGTKILTITSGETVRTLEIKVEKLPYEINPVTAGLELDFTPQGRTNQDADYNVFKNNVFDSEGNEIPISWDISDNFDWINGGWKTDENGDSYFCIKAGTSVNINYLLFNDANTLVGGNKTKGNGKEFKVIFKTSNVAKADTTWLSCLGAPETGSEVGIQMDAHTAYVKTSSGTNLTIPYSEEDKIEFDMNIVPISYKDNAVDLTTLDIPMIMTYEDGTPVRPLVLTDDTLTFKQQNAAPITIGSPYCDVHIYRIKAYSTYLSEKNILNNFIADASNADEMIDRYKRNQIYDTKGKLTPESYSAAHPDMRVITISAPRFTNDKKDKVLETEITMIHKNGDPVLDNWKATNAIHNGQGTSSNAYGYAARNLELNLKAKDTPRYKITKAEGVYNEDGEHITYGAILEGEQDFYDVDGIKYEDISTIASVTIIPGTTITLGDGSTTKKVSLTRDSVPTNYFNVKVNVASSEQANNALLQKRYDRYLPYTPYAESRDENIKNNMNFYNCVIFIQERNEDLTTHQEFNDTDWHFYSMGNIGDSKKTDDTRTSDPEDAKEFCVEIMDWNRELSAFPQDTKVAAMAEKYIKKDKEGNITKYIFATQENLEAGVLFERTGGRYVELPKNSSFNGFEYYFELADGKYVITKDTKNDSEKTYYEYVDWVYEVSMDTTIDYTKPYYVDILEQDDFSEDYTYGWRYALDDEDPEILAACKAKWIEFYRFVTRDLSYDDKRTDDNGNILEDPTKIAAWKEELKDWFVIDAAFYYYLFTLRYTMVDNRAKNSFWHYGKQGAGYKFDFWDYDNDTALGIDNTGKFTMGYGVEDHDTNEGGAAHFRAHNSTFFTRVADYFADELITYYKDTLENQNATVFNSTSLINEFDSWQSEFPEEIWRKQYERIYKRTYVGGYGQEWDNAINPAQIKKAADPQFLTEMMNGKKKYQRRQFERNQDVYMSSKFFGNTVFQDVLTLRGGGDMNPNQFVVKPNGDITITPYLNMYINVGVENNAFNHHVKVKAGESVTLKYPTSSLEFNYIWGASYLQSLGDLSPMYLRVAKLGQGKRLKQLTLGNPTEGYNNPNLENVEVTANNKLLEELDVRNMSKLTGAIPITNIASLRKLYAQGTSYQTVNFANNGLIEEAYLPSTIHTLMANNLYYLHTLELEDYSKLEKLLINNCPKLKEKNEQFVQKDLALVTAAKDSLKRVRLTNIDWYLPTADILNKLVECSGIGDDNVSDVDQSVLTGKVYIENIRKTEFDAFKAAWGDKLDITYGKEVPQCLVSFYNYNGVLLGTTHIDQGTKCIDPLAEGLFNVPVKESTAQYHFNFMGWSLKNDPDNKIVDIAQQTISSDTNFIAQYENIIRSYSVAWYENKNSSPYATTVVNYGEKAVFPGDIPTKPNFNNTIYYLFNGWDTSTSYITGDTKVYAIWAEANGAEVYNEVRKFKTKTTDQLTPIEIYALNQYASFNNLQGFEIGDFIKFQFGYVPTYSDDPAKERVLAQNLELTGSNYLVFEDIELFKEDKDFVIFLDFSPKKRSSGISSYLSCYKTNPEKGLRIYNQSGDVPVYLRFGHKTTPYYINTSERNVTNVFESRQDIYYQYREVCLIRHKKGQKGFDLYRNNRYSTDAVSKTFIEDTSNLSFSGWGEAANPLVIGADYNNGSYSNKAIGTINYAKIWFHDIEEEECMKICSWSYDEINFDYVGSNLYYYTYAEAPKCSASFIAQDLLDEPYHMAAYGKAVAGGWATTEMRTWMNEKLYKGVSLLWSQILKEVIVNSLQSTEAGGTATAELRKTPKPSNNFFYLPALAEVNSDMIDAANGVFKNEFTSTGFDDEVSGFYPVFGGNSEKETRIKTMNGIPTIWFTRSPYYTATSSSSTLGRYVAVTYEGDAENRDNWTKELDYTTENHSFRDGKKYGVCPCFSI